MNTESTIARERINAEFFAVTEHRIEESTGFRSTYSTTVSVNSGISLDELIAAARASAVHQLSIAKARRYFSDGDANKAVVEAEAFSARIENQIRKLSALPEIAALLLDMATEPQRRRAYDRAPTWAEVLAARASAQLTSLSA